MSESAIIAAIIGAFGAVSSYLLARRRSTGRVATTEANDLWREQRNFRDSMQGVIDNLRRRVDVLEADKARCLEELAELHGEVAHLREQLGAG